MPITGFAHLLHSSTVEIGANWANAEEVWLCRFGEYQPDEAVTDWFLDVQNIVLGESYRFFQGRLAIANTLKLKRHPKTRKAWILTLSFKAVDSGGGGSSSKSSFGQEPITKVSAHNGDSPTPNLTAPDTWDPVLLRRPHAAREGRPMAYYEGGFNGYAHNQMQLYANKRGLVVNSALIPISHAPGAISGGASWVFRVLTVNPVDTSVFSYEWTTNSGPVTFNHKGLTLTVPRHCLQCQGVSIGEQRVNNRHCWSIEIQFEEKYHEDAPTIGGFVTRFADVSFDARALKAAGDRYADTVDNNGQVIPGVEVQDPNSRVRKILDKVGRPVSDPHPLDGNGRELVAPAQGAPLAEPFKYVNWRYPAQLDWLSFPYLNRIIQGAQGFGVGENTFVGPGTLVG